MEKLIKYRKCWQCHEKKGVDEFMTDNNKPLGKSYLCKKCNKIVGRRYREKRHDWNKSHKESMRKANVAYIKKFPEKDMARRLLSKAVKNNVIKKLPCRVCGQSKVDAHHPDYSKPLDVLWLCRQHHEDYHHEKLK